MRTNTTLADTLPARPPLRQVATPPPSGPVPGEDASEPAKEYPAINPLKLIAMLEDVARGATADGVTLSPVPTWAERTRATLALAVLENYGIESMSRAKLLASMMP